MAIESVTVTISRRFEMTEEPYDELTKGLSRMEIIDLVTDHFHEDMADTYRTNKWLPSLDVETTETEGNN